MKISIRSRESHNTDAERATIYKPILKRGLSRYSRSTKLGISTTRFSWVAKTARPHYQGELARTTQSTLAKDPLCERDKAKEDGTSPVIQAAAVLSTGQQPSPNEIHGHLREEFTMRMEQMEQPLRAIDSASQGAHSNPTTPPRYCPTLRRGDNERRSRYHLGATGRRVDTTDQSRAFGQSHPRPIGDQPGRSPTSAEIPHGGWNL